MRAIIQRVTRASVTVNGGEPRAIGPGLVILLGVRETDEIDIVPKLADKCAHLRIFEDDAGKMNRSLQEVGGAILAVSQFTLLGDARDGRRPSFIRAERPEAADALYQKAVASWRGQGVLVETGVFGADMAVSLVNDGPVTILLDSRRVF